MLKVMAFLSKREDIETRAFIDYYENNHVPLIRGLAPTPIGYRRSYLQRGDELNSEDPSIDFDVVTELVFPDRDAFLAWGAELAREDGGKRVAEDEGRFLNRSRTRVYIVEEHVTSTPRDREERPCP